MGFESLALRLKPIGGGGGGGGGGVRPSEGTLGGGMFGFGMWFDVIVAWLKFSFVLNEDERVGSRGETDRPTSPFGLLLFEKLFEIIVEAAKFASLMRKKND